MHHTWGFRMNNGKKSILVVDDDADITGLIKQGLEYLYPSEYHVVYVNSGKKCFEVLEKNDQIPDIILLDISIPVMNVWEVLVQLNSHSPWKYIPVIFLSAEKDIVAKNFGKFLGIDLIEKPFEIENLKLRIEKILER